MTGPPGGSTPPHSPDADPARIRARLGPAGAPRPPGAESAGDSPGIPLARVFIRMWGHSPTVRVAIILVLAVAVTFTHAHAQDQKNPSLLIDTLEVPPEEFNRIARDMPVTQLERVHEISWQVTLDNDLIYENPNGNAVMRVYDNTVPEKFIEVGMGSQPDRKFWLAVQIPGEEGYVVVHSNLERGWSPSTRTILSYTDRAGLTVNNGERIVVSNLDVGVFAIGSYSTYGMEGSTDPPAINSGVMTVEFLSGDPSQNVFALFPYIITAAVGALVGGLFLTKRRAQA